MKKPFQIPACPYCQQPAKLVTGETVYPHRDDLAELNFWQCGPCDAHVGTHLNSKDHAPLGRLANAELRKWKQKAHAVFDPLWKSGQTSRTEAYKKLAEILGVPNGQAHIGRCDVDQCKKIVEALQHENANN